MLQSRRTFMSQMGRGAAGATVYPLSREFAFGTPLRRRLQLKVTNPQAVVADGQLKGCEFPPSVVTAGGRRYVFMSTGLAYAHRVESDFHLIGDTRKMDGTEPVYTIGGFDYELRRGLRPLNSSYRREDFYWKKTYCGTFNVDVMPPDSANPEWIFSINHNENKNERFTWPFGTFYVHNSINLNDPAGPKTSSGPTPTGYADYQPGYFGFVSMSYAPLTEDTRFGMILNKHDMGPILWPWSGFLTEDGKGKHPRYKNPHPHPSSLLAEDPKDGKKYLYIFQIESAVSSDGDRMIMASRAPIASRAMPGSFLNFYRGDYTEPSLPKNMKEDIALLLTRPGGRCDPIHPSLDGTHERMNRFFVARLKRSGLFLSVETYSIQEGNESYVETALRLSEDLRNWTGRFVVPNTRVSSRQRRSETPPFYMSYPKFLSADGFSHYEIDESERFYIIATKPHALVYRELTIEIA